MIGSTHAGGHTPEELETLFEDALLMHDRPALAALFEPGAVLDAGTAPGCRGAAIATAALSLWSGAHSYVADPRRVMQARDIALIVAARSIHVARRGTDGTWHYAVVSFGDARAHGAQHIGCTTNHAQSQGGLTP